MLFKLKDSKVSYTEDLKELVDNKDKEKRNKRFSIYLNEEEEQVLESQRDYERADATILRDLILKGLKC